MVNKTKATLTSSFRGNFCLPIEDYKGLKVKISFYVSEVPCVLY